MEYVDSTKGDVDVCREPLESKWATPSGTLLTQWTPIYGIACDDVCDLLFIHAATQRPPAYGVKKRFGIGLVGLDEYPVPGQRKITRHGIEYVFV